MKTCICIAMGLLAAVFFGDEARAASTSHSWAKPAQVNAAKAAADTVKVRYRRRSGLFANWCAYNCRAVPRCYSGHCLGRYGYSHYAYDEDLPFPYRWDRDASPTDNALSFADPFTGEPVMRAFERIY